MLGFQENSKHMATRSLKRKPLQKDSWKKFEPPRPKEFEVNKACFTNPWGLAGVSENELKDMMLMKL